MVKLKLKKYTKRINEGHLWVFSNEAEEIPKAEAGSIVEVLDYNSVPLGLAFFNPHTLVTARLLLTGEDINKDFFLNRINQAYQLRRRILPDENNIRLVFGESDFLPGLIIDKYEDYFAVQILSAGMENYKELIVESLLEIFPDCRGIIEKNNSKLRSLEVLPLQ
jgi:23S rRNA (cytosine1962-C5)-methyltransferase